MAFLKFKYGTKIIFYLCCLNSAKSLELIDHAIFSVIPPNFTQLAEEAGLPSEHVQVTTEDGYILDMFHIPGNKSHPVLLQSGNLGTCDDYITRGKTSLPYVLWSAGYDVWMGNVRGCRYGRRHVTLDPDLDDEFWNFSFHEFGVYDTPAMVDYILNYTQAKTLSSIGWSYGTAVNYIMGAERPEYNDKVNVIISFAPICYLHHSKPLTFLSPFAPIVNILLVVMNQNEFFGENSTELSLLRTKCSTPLVADTVCMKLGLYPIFGYDAEQMEPEFACKFFQHYPSSTSRLNQLHQLQILKTKTFAQYDHGPDENKKRYGSEKPKEYDLSKNKINVVLISGQNDPTSTLEDVELLKDKLPNIIEQIILKPEKFNHIGFVCGRDTHNVLYKPIILDILKKFNN